MDEFTKNRHAYAMLAILQGYAPNLSAQERCSKFLNRMITDGLSGDEVLKQLSGVLNDGLRTGNWPWVVDPEGRY